MALASVTMAARRASVAVHGQRQSEGEDQPDHSEQRRLQHGERLLEAVREMAQAADRARARARSLHHDREQDQRQSQAAPFKEERAGLLLEPAHPDEVMRDAPSVWMVSSITTCER